MTFCIKATRPLGNTQAGGSSRAAYIHPEVLKARKRLPEAFKSAEGADMKRRC